MVKVKCDAQILPLKHFIMRITTENWIKGNAFAVFQARGFSSYAGEERSDCSCFGQTVFYVMVSLLQYFEK